MTDSTRMTGHRNPLVAFPPRFRPLAATLMLLGPDMTIGELTESLGRTDPRETRRLVRQAESEGYVEVERHPGQPSRLYLTPGVETPGLDTPGLPEVLEVPSSRCRASTAPPSVARTREESESTMPPDPKESNLSIGQRAAIVYRTERQKLLGRSVNPALVSKAASIAKRQARTGAGTVDEILEAVRRVAVNPDVGPGFLDTELERLQRGSASPAPLQPSTTGRGLLRYLS